MAGGRWDVVADIAAIYIPNYNCRRPSFLQRLAVNRYASLLKSTSQVRDAGVKAVSTDLSEERESVGKLRQGAHL